MLSDGWRIRAYTDPFIPAVIRQSAQVLRSNSNPSRTVENRSFGFSACLPVPIIFPMSWLDRFESLFASNKDQRTAPRVRLRGVTCSLGQVINASMTGLAVACRGKIPSRPGLLIEFQLGFGDQTDRFSARMVRVEPLGFRRYQLGLEFVGLTVWQRRTLSVWTQASVSTEAKKSDTAESIVDPHEILGVSLDAPPETIREAFRKMALRYHPDATHSGDTARQFQAAHHAYKVLMEAHQEIR